MSLYDASIVHHSHSANLPHLNTWIDELLSLTENGVPSTTTPTTENLVSALQRYDAVFRELLRQTSIFSDPVTKMLAKVWAGVLKLLDYMIKSYHRYVKHTSSLQLQATALLDEKKMTMVGNKMREDEVELERTYYKAKIRNLEAEIESMQATKRSMDRENLQLRTILDVYMRSTEMNDPVWDITSEDSIFGRLTGGGQSNGHHHHHHQQQQQLLDAEAKESEWRRKNSIDAGKHQLRELYRLDIEMNEVLVNVLKEEDRQRLLVSDLMNLMRRNQEVFGAGNSVRGKWIAGVSELPRMVDMAIQVDSKDEFGAVSDLIETPREDILIQVPLLAPTTKTKGVELPYQMRSLMASFPHVLRVPPVAWVCQMIMSIYFDKIREDQQRQEAGLAKLSLGNHVYAYFQKTLKLDAIADVQVAQLMKACETYLATNNRIGLFSSQVGLYDKESAPKMDVRDTDFILSILSNLVKLGELVPEKASKKKLSKTSVIVKPDILRSSAISTVQTIFEKWLPDGGHDYVLKVKAMPHTEKGHKYIDVDNFIEILLDPWHTVRLNWEEHVTYMFKEHCTVHRVLSESQFATDSGAREKDTILSQVNKSSAHDCARRPVRYFQKLEIESKSKDTQEDAATGRKAGKVSSVNPNKEPVCELMSRKTFMATMQLMNPKLRFDEMDKMFNEALAFSYRKVIRSLETLWIRFTHTLSLVEINAHRGETAPTRDFYFNSRTNMTQWTRPYHQRTFHAQDIEMESFVAIAVQYDVMPKSPLLECLHIQPKDLWPNSDMFIKQLKVKQARESMFGSSTSPKHSAEAASSGPKKELPAVVVHLDSLASGETKEREE